MMKYFKREEFECNCGCGGLPVEDTIMVYCDKIREAVGRMLRINSGFRCEYWNDKVGGVSKSKHLTGMAADISTLNLSSKDRYILVGAAIKLGLRIGIYNSFIHVDYSPKELKVMWVG